MQVSITYAYYELDPISFIEQLCKNKDKPEMACNGKCHLKKVAESNSTDNKNAPNIIDFKELILFNENPITIIFRVDLEKCYQNYYYLDLYSYLNFSDCFRPPQQMFS